MSQRQNFVEQNSPTGHTIFTGQTTQLGAPWRSLSLRQARGTCHIQQSNIQHGNLPTHTHTVELIVGEDNFFNGALHWLGSHIPQLWPATLEVKLSQCRWASLVRGWLWGARLIWRYPTLSKLQLSK